MAKIYLPSNFVLQLAGAKTARMLAIGKRCGWLAGKFQTRQHAAQQGIQADGRAIAWVNQSLRRPPLNLALGAGLRVCGGSEFTAKSSLRF